MSISWLQITAELKKSLEEFMADSYWYSFYVDDLPTWAFLGERSTLVAPDAVVPGVPRPESLSGRTTSAKAGSLM